MPNMDYDLDVTNVTGETYQVIKKLQNGSLKTYTCSRPTSRKHLALYFTKRSQLEQYQAVVHGLRQVFKVLPMSEIVEAALDLIITLGESEKHTELANRQDFSERPGPHRKTLSLCFMDACQKLRFETKLEKVRERLRFSSLSALLSVALKRLLQATGEQGSSVGLSS